MADIDRLAAGDVASSEPTESVEAGGEIAEPPGEADTVAYESAPDEPAPPEIALEASADALKAPPQAEADAELAPEMPEPGPEAALEAILEAIEPEPAEPEPELAGALAAEIFTEPGRVEPPARHTVLAQIELMPVTEPGPAAELPGPADLSLGASLIASGIVAKPDEPRIDPLGPIRRMSQAEKIAFFS
jgi:hypothetical protein